MNKAQLLERGTQISKILEFDELVEQYAVWKRAVLKYVEENNLATEQYKLLLHVVETPFESKEVMREKYCDCIKACNDFLQYEQSSSVITRNDVEIVVENFGLYLQNMFRTEPENKATIEKTLLEQIVIQNEYDLQHIMYAVIKALYPSARREVVQDMGYGSVRYDIAISEVDTVIEIKCTRADHTEKKLLKELGEDAFFYNCSNLIMYIYDKQNIVSDINNFVSALERRDAGKRIKAFVEQEKTLM